MCDVDQRRKHQLSIVLFLYDKQLFARRDRRGIVTMIFKVPQPAATVHRLIGTRLTGVDGRGASSGGGRRHGRMFGAHVCLERDGLYSRVVAERTSVRLLSRVAHSVPTQRVVVARRVRTNVTPSTCNDTRANKVYVWVCMYVYSFIKKLTWRSLKHRNYKWDNVKTIRPKRSQNSVQFSRSCRCCYIPTDSNIWWCHMHLTKHVPVYCHAYKVGV